MIESYTKMIYEKEQRMLVILAHPDDESYGLGGTLAKYANQDVQVVLLCSTRGEAGIPGLTSEEAGNVRQQELLDAAHHLGIEVFFLGYRDGELENENPEVLLEHIASWIDTVRPQVILTFGPDGLSGHPDHVTVSRIVTRAVEKFFPDVCLLYIAPSEATVLGCGVSSSSVDIDEPLVSVDISDYKIEKIRAIQSHVSQHPPLEARAAEDEVDQVPCHEYFTVAHAVHKSNDLGRCFEIEEDLGDQLH